MSLDLRPLHLHTIETLCLDLISNRAVGVGKSNLPFKLKTTEARSALQWYFQNQGKWAGNVMAADVEALVDSLTKVPGETEASKTSEQHSPKRYDLVKLRAHDFAGIHYPTSNNAAPIDFIYEFDMAITMFEGLNGSGKTSLLNAIIWALTGEILRPQRAPESASTEFECEIEGNDSTTTHKLTPVTPLPDASLCKPNSTSIPANTWVELTFKDESGFMMAPIRREQKRTAKGKLEETVFGLSELKLDPIAFRSGTVIPGMLPFIQIGSESKLGKAVAELTGMAPLVKLASHAERAKKKIEGDLTKTKKSEIESFDQAYGHSLKDLEEKIERHPSIKCTYTLPPLSSSTEVENIIAKTIEHFENIKAKALSDAKQVLGAQFDAGNIAARVNLENNIAPAITIVRNLSALPSAARLNALSKVSQEEVHDAQRRIELIFHQANTLKELASDPSKAGRIRLYSRIASWSKEHIDITIDEKICLVCGQELGETVDMVTGKTIRLHLHEASTEDASLLSLTLSKWAQLVQGELARELASTLQSEIRKELPQHPSDLILQTLTIELFKTEPYLGVLSALGDTFSASCKKSAAQFPPISESKIGDISLKFPELRELQVSLARLDTALRFIDWRQSNKDILSNFMQTVVGQVQAEESAIVTSSLLGQLQRLQEIVKGVEPINDAITLCARMEKELSKRRKAEQRLLAYSEAVNALNECMGLGALAEDQVKQLQEQLQKRAVIWRNHIYRGAFPSTNHDLVATRMDGEGQLQIYVGSKGVAAPAQHVANASALRASLVGFFLAYWDYLLRERGGLNMLLLDDPQELLDSENRERLANTICILAQSQNQLILTTHDSKFAATLMRSAQAKKTSVDYQYIHPATKLRGTLYPSPSLNKIHKCSELHLADPDNPEAAQDYAAECRIFIEGRLGDLFDDAAFPAAATPTLAPTLMDHLSRLRGLVKGASNELYRSPVLQNFCKDSALRENSPVLGLLNKAHHSSKQTIQPAEVVAASPDLERLRREVERIHEEFRLFRRREPLQQPLPENEIPALESNVVPNFDVKIMPNLVAFTRGAAVGESQEIELENLSSSWFEHKAFFLLRSNNFGFAGPATSVAIVDTVATKVEDRRLVIARQGSNVFARRLLRPINSDLIALAAETPDPRKSPQTLLFSDSEVSLHRVVGLLFGAVTNPPKSKQEAVSIDGHGLLPMVQTAYKIKEESAIPLALPDQIALGGPTLSPSDFDKYLDGYVALHLSDGTSILKRIGKKLPAPLSHLRRFETIGGLGVADILAIEKVQQGIHSVEHAVLIVGVLYHS